MSKFQLPYNQAVKKSQREMVPTIKKQINSVRAEIRDATDPDLRKGLQAKLKALEIKMKSYRSGDPVKEDSNIENEESQAAVTTGSIGSPTMSNSEGGTEPAAYGSSYIHPGHKGTVSRKGYYKAPDFDKKKKKKKKGKKNYKEFVEYYFKEDFECLDKIECENCGKEFKYNFERDVVDVDDLDYDENPITKHYVVCPYCKERVHIS